jgi:hypothetical protein
LPPIPAHFLDSVVFLYPSREAAESGKGSGGSGFLASVPVYDGRALYIVTNEHVALNANAARLTTRTDRTHVLDTPVDGWREHPDGDDVAVFALALSEQDNYRLSAIEWTTFVHMPTVVSPGDDVFFLGRYVEPDGTQTDSPVARFGHVALQGTVKVVQDKRGYFEQESFMVEALSLSGFSGSPVAAFRMHLQQSSFGGAITVAMGEPASRADFQQGTTGTPALLGITWGHHHENAPVRRGREKTDMHVEQNRGIANVVPAWKITELLKSEELVTKRKQQSDKTERERREREQQPGGNTLDSLTEEDEEWTREDFMRDLRRASRPDEKPPKETE